MTKRCVIWLLFLFCAGQLFAHDPGLSSINLQINPQEIDAVVTFNDRDIANVLGEEPGAIRRDTAAAQSKLDALAPRVLLLETAGRAVAPSNFGASVDDKQNVEFHLTFPRSSRDGTLSLRSALLKEMPFGHRQAFAARDSAGREIARQLLSSQQDVATVATQGAAQVDDHTFLDFFLLGVRHILTGYDHLLFLFGLLVICRTGRSAALLITCFTLAHSLTLALSTFGLVQLPSRFVEAAIAGSILYVGAENLIRGEAHLRGRWLLTFAFGLVHGLGFASVLREMGVANSGVAAVVPLVAFNAGVEAGQLAVAAILLPIFWRLRRSPRFLRIGIPACSAVVAVAGGYWLVQRVFFT
ncbi:MAG: HupE/UreJ family protein [Spartobacteria bacterium]